MSEWINKPDIWGIRKAVRAIWDKSEKRIANREWNPIYKESKEAEFFFNIFFNQRVPETYRESLSTVIRHIDEIRSLAESQFVDMVWYSRNGQLSTTNIGTRENNWQFWQSIDKNEVILPTYLEIEKEQQRWQTHQHYNKERGFSSPIKEEFIQIKIHK